MATITMKGKFGGSDQNEDRSKTYEAKSSNDRTGSSFDGSCPGICGTGKTFLGVVLVIGEWEQE
jgi:hypothetical protein